MKMEKFFTENKIACFKIDVERLKKAGMGACMGNEHIVICDFCNEEIEDVAYYVPVLNQVVCKKCLDEQIKKMQSYDEDKKFENRNAADFEETIRLVDEGLLDLKGQRNIYVTSMDSIYGL